MTDPGDRRGDWQNGVDENLASLNAGQRVWERDQKTIQKLIHDMDALLRGDVDKETDGLIARLHRQENEINMFKSVIDVDRAGNKGLVSRVESLERRERTSDTRLKLWIALVGLISALLVAAISNFDRFEAFFNRKSNDPVDRAIERAKHPHKKHYRIRIIPAPEETDEGQ